MIHNHEVGGSFPPLATRTIKHLHIQQGRCFLFYVRVRRILMDWKSDLLL